MANHLDVVDQMNEIDRLRAELVAKADEYVRNMAIAIDTRDSEIERLCAELEVTKLERDTALTDRHDTIQNLRAELATANVHRDAAIASSDAFAIELARSLEENKRVRKDYEIVTVELAEAKAHIAELENKNSYNLQIVREATARIAELEAAGNRLGDAAIAGILDGNDAVARAEAEELKAKAHIAALCDAMVYSDSYGVQGSDFQCCHACNAGGAPNVALKHDERCPVGKAEASAAEWWDDYKAAEEDRDIAEAERDALREALRKIEQETIDHVAVRIARAALAPSPAGRERGRCG